MKIHAQDFREVPVIALKWSQRKTYSSKRVDNTHKLEFFSGYQTEICSFTLAQEFNTDNSC